MRRAVTILEATPWARSIRSSRSETTLAFWRTQAQGLLISSTFTRAFSFSSLRGVSVSTDLVAQWRQNLDDGVYGPVPGFLLAAASGSRVRDLSGTDRVWRSGGRSIDTPTCRPISESSMPASFSRKHRRDATSITRSSGPDTNSKALVHGTTLPLRLVGGSPVDRSCIYAERFRHH